MTINKTAAREVMERAVGASNVSDVVDGRDVDGIFPQVVVTPNSVDELAGVMTSANQEGLAVAPWGGGTRIDLGNSIRRLDVVADLTRLNDVLQHNAADLTVTVEAGITLSDLRRTLASQGQFLALDAAMPDEATIGGTLASGAGGPLKWQHGSPRDLVIGMKVVQADGRIVKSGGQVVKNVSGYDMARLHIGSIGTLGVIAEVSFKLTPLPRQESTVLAAFDSAQACHSTAMAIFSSDVMPLSMTAFDADANRLGGVIDAPGSNFLAVRLGGRPRTLARFEKETLDMCGLGGPTSVERIDGVGAGDLWRKLTDFGWGRDVRPLATFRASLLPSRVLEITEAIGEANGFDVAIVSQPAYGTVQISWFGDDSQSDAARIVLDRAWEAVHNLEGSSIVERCPVEVKADLDVWGDVGEPINIMRRLKEQYDPKGTINPGRFVGRI